MDERNYGIDLLRLILMFMVCMLHVLYHGGILEACKVGSLNYNVFWFLETFSCCAVDSFALISGYMAKNRTPRFSKLVEMWFQVFFYSFILTLISVAVGYLENPGVLAFIKMALPVTFKEFWYFTAYFGLTFAIPVLNKYLFSIDEKTAKSSFIVLIFLFTFMERIGSTFETGGGYSTIWLMALYSLGVLAKRIGLFENQRNISLILLWLCSLLLSWLFVVVFGTEGLLGYTSPTTIFDAFVMVVLFSRLRVKGTIIKKLVPYAFGIYLFQLSRVVWTKILDHRFGFVAEKGIVEGVILIFAFSGILFIVGLVSEFLRTHIAKMVRIHKLSEWIVSQFAKLIPKFYIFLK